MQKRVVLLLSALTLLLLLAVGVPAILRAMPDRYVARLPEPLQQLGAPEAQAPILPTVAAPAAAARLLQTAATDTAVPRAQLPPTLTPVPTVTPAAAGQTAVPTAEPPATPSPTPLPTPTLPPIPPAARLEGISHHFQTWNNCGPATMAMTLSYFDHFVTQSDVATVLKPDPEDRNVSPEEMAAYVNAQTPFQATYRVNGTRAQLQRFVANGIPVIIEIGIDPPGEFRWLGWYGHYLLVVAYDEAREQFWVYDSWFGTSEEPLQNAHPDGRILTYAELETYWTHFNRSYIPLYRPEQADLVADIVGAAMDDAVMWREAYARVQADAAAAPDNAFNWFNLGTVANALGQYEDAALAFDQARAIGLPWRMLWYQFGPYEAYYQVGRYEDILLLADRTLQDRPYFEESYYYKGLALAALGRTPEARENLEKAAAFNPNFAAAAQALAGLDE